MTYRLVGLDGVTRTLRDRARPRRKPDGGILVEGIVSDVTACEQAAARLAEASDRFTSLLDVVGAHVYLTLALPDGTLEELFQGPGGDRLLGGAEPDPDMVNWDTAVHPDDRRAYDEFNQALCRGEDTEVTYRLIGADGITRWVHDRAACRRRPDGAFEVSGIVSDVTERRRLEDELKRSMVEGARELEQARRGRAAGEHRRAHRDIQPPPLRRDRDRVARVGGRPLRTAPARRRPFQADQRRVRPRRRRRGAGRARAAARAGLGPGDCLARWGGEEFAVLLREVASDGELVGAPSGSGARSRAGRSCTGTCASSSPSRSGVRSPPAAPRRSTRSWRPPTAASTRPSARAATACRCVPAARRRERDRGARGARAGPRPLVREQPPGGRPARSTPSRSHAWRRDGRAPRAARRAVLRCRLGGWLHDVGKLAIPEQILIKPGPLDDAEWAVMRTHPVVGAAIVGRVAALRAGRARGPPPPRALRRRRLPRRPRREPRSRSRRGSSPPPTPTRR